jgi:ribose transport system ATP-binding protein
VTPASNNPGAAGDSPAAPGATPFALSVEHLSKDFAGTRALTNVSLAVRPGTVHALLGGNGSGKSTTIKILAGVYTADSGTLAIFGKPYDLRSFGPATAQHAGLRFVHQDLGLFDELSIEENFALDAGYPTRGPGIDWRNLRKRVQTLLDEYELAASPAQPVNTLRPSDQTMVAIARALQTQDQNKSLILVLDEPTARLAAHESELLLENIKRRALLGQTVIIVSHRLREVLSVAQDFTVYRDGRVAAALVDATPTEDELVGHMAGRAVGALRPTGQASHARTDVVFSVAGLRSGPVAGVDFQVHQGEILGLTGLVGSGRSSVLKTIFGELQPSAGEMTLNGEPHAPANVGDAMQAGVALVPEDRVHEATFPDQTVSENIAVATLAENWTRGWMPRGRERERATSLIRKFGVKVAGPDAPFTSMSGGNQQKTIIARWLNRAPKLLLLDEPTQGVDVMSRADIYAVIRQAAADGCAVVVASSDPSEINALADRTLVLARGKVVAEVLVGELDVEGLNRLVLRERPTSSDDTADPEPTP